MNKYTNYAACYASGFVHYGKNEDFILNLIVMIEYKMNVFSMI